MSEKYEDLTNSELKELLRDRELPVGGNKQDLLKRLKDSDNTPEAEPDKEEPEEPKPEEPEKKEEDLREEPEETEPKKKPKKKLDVSKASIKELCQYLSNPNVKVGKRENEKLTLPAVGSRAEVMLRALVKQPKVRIILPLGHKEKPGQEVHPATLNGLHFIVGKGVYIELPEQVAQLYMEYYNQQTTALNQFLASEAKGDAEAQELGIGAGALRE